MRTLVSSTPGASPGKDTGLDGLRGLAALVVVLSHAFFGFFPYTHTGAPSDLRFPWEKTLFESPMYALYSGGFAVTLFFILSGYVLSKRFFEGADIDYLRAAAYKRYFRLGIPVFAAVMVGYAVIALRLAPEPLASLPTSFAWGSYHVSPGFLDALRQGVCGSLLLGDQSYDYVLWSIQLEFYGSLFLFGFLALFGRGRFFEVAAALAILVMLQLSTSSPTYIAMFLFGALINRMPRTLGRAIFNFPLLIVGFLLAGYRPNAEFYVPLVSLAIAVQGNFGLTWNWPILFEGLGAWMIVTAVVCNRNADRILSWRPIRWAGRLSFSVYLLHTFVLSTVGLRTFAALEGKVSYLAAATIATMATFVVSLVLAEPFQRIIDKRAIDIANRVGRFISQRKMTSVEKAAA